MDAKTRAQELMFTKIKDLPEKAYEFAKYQSELYGLCGEVLFTSYCIYAQIIEGLKCLDDMYKPGAQSILWFENNKE